MVEQKKSRWKFAEVDEHLVKNISGRFGIDKVVATVMVSNGISNETDAARFIFPKLANVADPFLIVNMDSAVKLLDKHIQAHSEISVIGDYDVDGITGVSLFLTIMHRFNRFPKFFIPRRFTEGYGISDEIVDRMLAESNPKLVVAIDCGTNCAKQLRDLTLLGIDVIVIDHHISNGEIFNGCVLVNPHIFPSVNNTDAVNLCAVGLIFKLMHAFLKLRRAAEDRVAFDIKLSNYLDLVALGTIADMVPMEGENRIFTKFGLENLAAKKRPGLAALCLESGIRNKEKLSSADVSFKLAPRINVCGRLSDASLPVELLLSNDMKLAKKLAATLETMNKERQKIEHEITAQASKIVDTNYQNAPGIVLYNENWHSGVVGIVSGKLCRDYNKPCIVLGKERGLAKGSGRSIHPYNLMDIISKCQKNIETWGGHAFAVGISLSMEKIDQFRNDFCKAIADYQLDEIEMTINVVCELNSKQLCNKLILELDQLQPYGQKNDEPIFCLRNVHMADPETFGIHKNHFKFNLFGRNNLCISCIAWNMSNNMPELNKSFDMLVKIGLDSWNNFNRIQLTVVDWQYVK
ncbi:MAG: single-stranded-DNA-specific exonuclease RecJ [Puniceicoccales bacterium]|nr:single-stranded-DNA-specific exonuclease RecJ [Puniceicoccales bacterium]